MIIARAPLRISFAGGGSDLPDFYRKHGGAVLSTTINKYVYLGMHPYFDLEKIHLKYSKNELVDQTSKIQHQIFKTVLDQFQIKGIEITSIADVPAGTGMGSSSSFTVALYLLMNAWKHRQIGKEELANLACTMEIDLLKEPIGKQDQYAAAYGGLNLIRFFPNDEVQVQPVLMSKERINAFKNNLLVFFTGETRDAKSVLSEQKKNIRESEQINKNLIKMTSQAFELKKILEEGNLDDFGTILHEGWLLKKALATNVRTAQIDAIYQKAISHGALGGKLLGAGGGGFLLFYCKPENHDKLRSALSGLRELKFSLDSRGAEVIFFDHTEVT